MNKLLSRAWGKVAYNSELVLQLLVVFAGAATYGVIEAKWIRTDLLSLPILGRFSYYHIGLLTMMTIMSFALAIQNFTYIIQNKKKYTILMCVASLLASLMIEDISWFVTKWQPIAYNEWTVVPSGWAINIGFTYLPIWYIGVTALCVVMFWIAGIYAERGYQSYRAYQANLMKM